MEPGRGVEFVRLPTVRGVSVWPKPSKMVIPVCSRQKSNRSGFSASPAVVQYWRLDRSKASTSTSVMRRYIVGGQHKVVTPYFPISARISAGL